MLAYPDNIIFNIILEKLNGFENIARYIIDIKNDQFSFSCSFPPLFFDLDKIREETIERAFYYWLENDLKIRQLINQHRSSLHILNNDLLDYYTSNLDNLGLNHEFRRVKGLSKCFQSKWWKTTSKKNIEWDIIHKIIKNNIVVFKSNNFEYNKNDINGWDELTYIQSKKIINLFYNEYIYQKDRFILEEIMFLYLDMDSHPIIIE